MHHLHALVPHLVDDSHDIYNLLLSDLLLNNLQANKDSGTPHTRTIASSLSDTIHCILWPGNVHLQWTSMGPFTFLCQEDTALWKSMMQEYSGKPWSFQDT